MSKHCTHTHLIAHVTPSALGCEECRPIKGVVLAHSDVPGQGLGVRV